MTYSALGVLPGNLIFEQQFEWCHMLKTDSWNGERMFVKLRTVVWGIVMVAVCCSLIAGSMLMGPSEERVVPRSIEQPLSPGRVKALAKGADAVVIEDRHA
jgi:hypothetical protein